MTNTLNFILLRNFEDGDEKGVVELWNRCLVRDPITPGIFRRKVILDPNFDPAGCTVAVAGGEVVGFMLALVRRVPMPGIGLQENTGWITSFFVHPAYRQRGIGSSMLNRALEFFRQERRAEVWVSPYTPHYFFPGVDVDAYPEALRLLEAHGFAEDHRVVGMSRKLLDFTVPPAVVEIEKVLEGEGIRVITLEPRYIPGLLKFMQENFPGDWERVVREKLEREADEDITVAVRQGEVVGYCQHEGERFGPFGVSPALRGRNIGTVLFHRTVERMKARGYKHLWLAWTHGAARRFYENHGLAVDRTHAILKLRVDGEV